MRIPYASLRWHYPDQVQRVFLTHAAQTSNPCATQDPRVSSAHDTPAVRCLATALEIAAGRSGDALQPWTLVSFGLRGGARRKMKGAPTA
ncbi:hypothetical protein P3T43_004714 [Paraburkholderia sp. GAS41]